MIFRIFFLKKSIFHFFLPLPYLFYAPFSILICKNNLIMSRRSQNKYQEKRPWVIFIEKMLHKKMIYITGNSIKVIEDLRKEDVTREKLKLIYNGVDTDKFNKNNFPSNFEVLEKNNHPKIINIVCLANLYKYKGHFDLVKAIYLLSPEIKERLNLKIIGRDAGIKIDLMKKIKSYNLEQFIELCGQNLILNIF